MGKRTRVPALKYIYIQLIDKKKNEKMLIITCYSEFAN